ncbi:MAG: extracellular solute-binding protein [Clostridiales bacterium]|nr:extracellular solute-binding protein [Clostridiales bacterium]
MKKGLKLLPLFMVAALFLSSCGGEGAAPTNAPPAATGGPAAVSLADIEPGARLVYWSMWNEAEPQGAVIAEAAAAFSAATGVPVDVNFNGRDIRKTLEPALSAGEVIDLFDEDVDRVINAWGDYLLPLDAYVDASYPDTNGQPYRAQVSKTLIDLAENLGAARGYSDGGKIHSIPYQPSIFTTMYNKDLFAAAGVTGVPATWDEFLDVCGKLKSSGVTPLTVDDAYMAALFGYVLDRVVGAEKCAEIVANLDFSDPGVLRACEIFEELADNGYLSSKAATNVWPAGQVDEFAKSAVAMYLNGTWLPNEIKSQTEGLNWGSFAWPAIDAAGDGVEANNYGGQSFGINKNTAYPNAAFAFVRFMTVGEFDQKLADESMGVPMGVNANWPIQLAEARNVFENSSKRLPWAVNMEDNAEVNAAIKDGLAKVVIGEYTARQFADALAALK